MGSFTGVASGSTADAKILVQDWVSATNASGGIDGHPVQAIYTAVWRMLGERARSGGSLRE